MLVGNFIGKNIENFIELRMLGTLLIENDGYCLIGKNVKNFIEWRMMIIGKNNGNVIVRM